jgi:MFS family permease
LSVADENPYKPPTAPVRDTGAPVPRSLTLAVLAGLGVGIGGMILSRVIQAIVYVTLIEPGATPQQPVEALSAWFLTLVSSSCIFSVLGGYVCARVARRHERRGTLVLAVLSTAIAYWTIGSGALATLVLALMFASVMAGGGFGRYRNLAEKRKTAAPILA